MGNLGNSFRDKFLTRKGAYRLEPEIISQFEQFAKDYIVIAFSAEWCGDCATNIPVLALISEATGLEVRVFGGLKKDPLSKTKKWRIPPSPPEVEMFKVEKIPLIIFNMKGNEIGRIIEKPEEPTLEEEMLKIILRGRR
ncbi:MAG: thioredoxin family protein [Candidatus Bathyarchaeia archaeon]